jgi:hypothetical protein
MEQRHSEPEHLLHHQLRFVHIRMLGRIKLLVEIVFTESKDGYDVGALADGELDETFALLEDEFEGPWLRVERFARAADDDGDGAAHPLAVAATLGENVFAAFARDGGEAHAKSVIAVERDAEVGVEGEEGVGDSWEELLETEGFGGESGEGAVGDDAVGVVAEDVLAVRWRRAG